jgi:hypothetical protein
MFGCGLTLLIITGLSGFFFPPAWILTVVGAILMVGGRKK